MHLRGPSDGSAFRMVTLEGYVANSNADFFFFFLEMEVSNFKKKAKAPKNIKLKYRQKTLVIDATTSHLTLLKIRNKITCKSFSYCYPR